MVRVALTILVSVLVGVAVAAAPAGTDKYPARITSLPAPFSPEGVAIDHRQFFAGNTATGGIFTGDLQGDPGHYLVPGVTDGSSSAFGIFPDRRGRLWVAGGGTGNAYVYDERSGQLLAKYVLEPGTPKRINDVYVTKDAAYFTCGSTVCFEPTALYRVAIDRGGKLSDPNDPASVTKIHLTGIPTPTGPRDGLNGIRGWDHDRMLIVGQTGTGKLWAVDPETGAATNIPLVNQNGDPELVPTNDGFVIAHNKLAFSVSNQTAGYIAAIRFAKDIGSGTVLAHLGNPDFPLQNPSTVDFVDGERQLYVLARDRNNPTLPVGLTRIDVPKNKDLESDD